MPERDDSASERFPVTVEQDGATFTLTAMVPDIERRTEPGPDILGGDRIGLYARLDLVQGEEPRPTTYFMSRLVGEPEWVIDTKFGPNGFPHFSHGFGSRVTLLKTVLPELADLLDDLARDRGLAAHIGRGIPLDLDS